MIVLGHGKLAHTRTFLKAKEDFFGKGKREGLDSLPGRARLDIHSIYRKYYKRALAIAGDYRRLEMEREAKIDAVADVARKDALERGLSSEDANGIYFETMVKIDREIPVPKTSRSFAITYKEWKRGAMSEITTPEHLCCTCYDDYLQRQ